ncbi:unnamed protein product [Cylindrotheca closterium]|uniref:AB hydrolase-1 domain-containing protein n=1 Tax=Cylindrotheca closterium TaxID=2856 RepID=A0AAD2FBI2_9STRA|nr:unnamed protein product [Cylindrotheca closterium]
MLKSCFAPFVSESQDENENDDSNAPPPFFQLFETLVQHERFVDEASGRTISYGIGGDPKGSPILVFPPLSAKHRMLVMMHDDLVQASLKAICVNRPGIHGTSPSKDAVDHLNLVMQDALAVLDKLEIPKVGILCMCAGTTYALKLYTAHPERTTRRILGLAPWTLPADCPHSRGLYKFAANRLPRLAVGGLVSKMEMTMMGFVSKETIASKIDETCSEEESEYLKDKLSKSPHKQSFPQVLEWMMEDSSERNAMEVAVCLSSSQDFELDYRQVDGTIVIWQGDKDNMAPVQATQWLANQFGTPGKVFFVDKGTHSGALFVLDSRISQAFHMLKEQ